MAKFNPKGRDARCGFGAVAAKQDSAALLRRAVMSCLLWEDMAYESGEDSAQNIASLVPLVEPETVAQIAIESREKQKLRHVPLWIAVQMLKSPEHKKLVRGVIGSVITRADQLTDLIALYWKDGKKPLPRQMKLGLADAFQKFDEYRFAKYDRDNEIKLRDALRLCHAKPSQGKEELFKKVNERTLTPPDTWEVALSGGADKKATWERLISEKKIGNLAFLRNLRNMVAASVDPAIVRTGLANINDKGLLPLNFLAAQDAAPKFAAQIEEAMLRVYSQREKLHGHTVLVIDVSGSMGCAVSAKSQFSRIDAGAAMAILARETCEMASIYVTAGSDRARIHQTKQLPSYRGFGLLNEIRKSKETMGGGGIFTRQCLEFIKSDMAGETPKRIIVFSDSQDCDHANSIPAPFGWNNYIVDVSAHKRGINYKGVWTSEIAGFSEHFLTFISAMEGQVVTMESGE